MVKIGGYRNIPRGVKGYMQRLREHPEIALHDLPEARTAIEGMQAANEISRKRAVLTEGGIFEPDASPGGNDTLSQMSLDELKYLESKLGWIINEWHRIVFHAVWKEAKREGIKELYWNVPESVKGGAPEGLKQVMYNKAPESLGFRKQKTNLFSANPKESKEFWQREASSNPPDQQIDSLKSLIARSGNQFHNFFNDLLNGLASEEKYINNDFDRYLEFVEVPLRERIKDIDFSGNPEDVYKVCDAAQSPVRNGLILLGLYRRTMNL